MGAEIGATTSIFPYDENIAAYVARIEEIEDDAPSEFSADGLAE